MNASSEAATGDGQARISVFLLDDHEVVRRGLRNLLTAEPGIDVIGEAGTVASESSRRNLDLVGLPCLLDSFLVRLACCGPCLLEFPPRSGSGLSIVSQVFHPHPFPWIFPEIRRPQVRLGGFITEDELRRARRA